MGDALPGVQTIIPKMEQGQLGVRKRASTDTHGDGVVGIKIKVVVIAQIGSAETDHAIGIAAYLRSDGTADKSAAGDLRG